MIVADTNLIVALLVEGPLTSFARAWATAHPVWHVPRLWRYEFTNVVVAHLKAGALAQADAPRLLRSAMVTFGDTEHDTDQLKVLDLSLRLRLSPYDANFILLAEQLGTRCVTNDRAMLERAPRYTRAISLPPDAG